MEKEKYLLLKGRLIGMSEEEKEAVKLLKSMINHKSDNIKLNWRKGIYALQLILNLIEKQQAEIEQLKYSITKAAKIIDEYANETEKDTKKLIEYQENFLQKLLDEEK